MVVEDLKEKRPSKVGKVEGLLNGHAKLYDFLKACAEEEKTSVEELVVQLIQTYKRWVDEDAAQRREQELKEEIVPLPKEIDSEPLKQKIRSFFEALIDKDFERAYAVTGIKDHLRKYVFLEKHERYSNVVRIISIDEPYQKGAQSYAGIFVPYEIELASGAIWRGAIPMLPMQHDTTEGEWRFDGGL